MPTPPVNQPTFDTNFTNATQPDSNHQANGWQANEIPTSANFNWLFATISEWIAYLSAGSSGARVIGGFGDPRYWINHSPTGKTGCRARLVGGGGGGGGGGIGSELPSPLTDLVEAVESSGNFQEFIVTGLVQNSSLSYQVGAGGTGGPPQGLAAHPLPVEQEGTVLRLGLEWSISLGREWWWRRKQFHVHPWGRRDGYNGNRIGYRMGDHRRGRADRKFWSSAREWWQRRWQRRQAVD